MEQDPVIFASHRIFVALTQEAHVVGVFQLLDAGGVASEPPVITTNGARILVPAVNKFVFLVPLERSLGGGHRGSHGDDH